MILLRLIVALGLDAPLRLACERLDAVLRRWPWLYRGLGGAP